MLSHRKSCLILHVANVCIFSASSVFGWKPLLCLYEIEKPWRLQMPRCRKPHMTLLDSCPERGKCRWINQETSGRSMTCSVLFQFRNPFLMCQQAPITSTIATVRNVIHVTPNNWGPSIRGLTIIWILAVWSLLFLPLHHSTWMDMSLEIDFEDWRTKTMVD